MPHAGLLDHPSPACQHRTLSADLVAQCGLDRLQRVDVLGLGARAKLAGAFRHQRDVRVTTHVAALHAGLGDAECPHQFPQVSHVLARYRGTFRTGSQHRFSDDLHEWDAGPVVVEQRVVGALDPAGTAHVGGLAGVFLHVDTFDRDRIGLPVHHDGDLAVETQRFVVLRDLVVLRHVRVEVVLPREPAPLGDPTAQAQADPDGRLDGRPVHHGQ